jgi:hypothetical protein
MAQQPTDQKNRRRVLRRRPKHASRVACYKGPLGLGANLALELLDLSESGVRLRIKEALPCQQEVEVQLIGLGHSKPVKLRAVVAWCVPAADGSCCIGARFDKGLRYADLQYLA